MHKKLANATEGETTIVVSNGEFYLLFEWKMHVYMPPNVALIGFLTLGNITM